MASYLIVHSVVQGIGTSVTLAPTPQPLTGQTSGMITSVYFTQGTTVADTQLGAAPVIARLLALGAIA